VQLPVCLPLLVILPGDTINPPLLETGNFQVILRIFSDALQLHFFGGSLPEGSFEEELISS
jgi:hypothetical protein